MDMTKLAAGGDLRKLIGADPGVCQAREDARRAVTMAQKAAAVGTIASAEEAALAKLAGTAAVDVLLKSAFATPLKMGIAR